MIREYIYDCLLFQGDDVCKAIGAFVWIAIIVIIIK